MRAGAWADSMREFMHKRPVSQDGLVISIFNRFIFSDSRGMDWLRVSGGAVFSRAVFNASPNA
jgi:hypothetical protein